MSSPLFTLQTQVVIPALNEADGIANTIRRWLELGFPTICVVDNGSHDRTAEVAQAAGATVVQEPRRGYGAAAWAGVQSGHSEWILFSSADGSDRLEPAELADWQAAIESGADLVLGDRTALPESRTHLKAVQRWGNWVQCAGIRLGWGAGFRDMGSLRLIRRSTLRRLHLQDRGYGWNLEMQVRWVELQLPWRELPVGYHPREAGESKISGTWSGSFRAGVAILKMLSQLVWLRRNPLPTLPTPPLMRSVETTHSRH